MAETLEQLSQRAAEIQQIPRVLNEHIDLLNDVAWKMRCLNPILSTELCLEALNLTAQNHYVHGRAYALRNLGVCQLRTNSPHKAITTLKSARKTFFDLNDETGLVSVDNLFGLSQKILGNYESALEYHLKALRTYRKIDNGAGVASVLNNVSNIYFRISDYSQSLEYNYNALPYSAQPDAVRHQAPILTSLGEVLWRVGESSQSITVLQQALSLLQTHPDKHNEAGALINLGNSYQSTGSYNEAMNYYNQAFKIARKIGSFEAQAEARIGIGSIYCQTNDLPQALASLSEALELSQNIGSRFYESQALLELGTAYRQLGDERETILSLERALEISHELSAKETIYKTHLALSEVYEQQGKTNAALHHYQAFYRVQDEIYNFASARRIQHLLFSQTRRRQLKPPRAANLQKTSSLQQSALSPRKLQEIKQFVAHHLAENISGAELAAVAGLNHDHFIRVFKQSTDQTPHQYLIEQRVERAKQLMRTTALPLSEIALSCGFSDQSHLGVQFRLSTGSTPKQFRQSF